MLDEKRVRRVLEIAYEELNRCHRYLLGNGSLPDSVDSAHASSEVRRLLRTIGNHQDVGERVPGFKEILRVFNGLVTRARLFDVADLIQDWDDETKKRIYHWAETMSHILEDGPVHGHIPGFPKELETIDVDGSLRKNTECVLKKYERRPDNQGEDSPEWQKIKDNLELFFSVVKARLKEKHMQGRSGWDNPSSFDSDCAQNAIGEETTLRNASFVDIAAYAMFGWYHRSREAVEEEQ